MNSAVQLAISTQKLLFHSLPYEMRRSIYKATNPRVYNRLQELASTEQIDSNTQSMKPFKEHECIFVHIPKCAGTSVSISLFGSPTGGHTNVREYKLVFSKQEFAHFFKFTFVRNPWDRLVSAFFFLKNGGKRDCPEDAEWAEEHLSEIDDFDTFVKVWLNRRNIEQSLHFLPQYQFVCSRGSNKLLVDFVGYFENIGEDFNLICEQLKIDANLDSLNKSANRKIDYREYYSDETRQIVANVYRKDIKMFGYDFDNTMLKDFIEAKRQSTSRIF